MGKILKYPSGYQARKQPHKFERRSSVSAIWPEIDPGLLVLGVKESVLST